jgi:hypothetical protein
VLALAIFRRRRSDRKRLSTRGCSVCAVIFASNSGREQCMVSGSPGPMWRPRNAGVRGGTMSSNLLCSSGESTANLPHTASAGLSWTRGRLWAILLGPRFRSARRRYATECAEIIRRREGAAPGSGWSQSQKTRR